MSDELHDGIGDDERERHEERRRVIPPAPPSLVPPAGMSLFPPAMDVPAPPPSRVPAPPSTRSLPPMPAIEPILDAADASRKLGQWDDALEAYKKALFVLAGDDVATRASIYASVAEVKLAQGKDREAETNFEKSLTLRPGHLRSLDGLVTVAERAGEWARVVAYREKRAAAQEDSEEAARDLLAAGAAAKDGLNDARRAALLFERVLEIAPGNAAACTRLEALYAGLRDWPKLLSLHDHVCRSTEDPGARGRARFAQADLCLGRLRNEAKGLAFLELALDEDPQHDRALSALVAVRTRREEWAELAGAYERLAARLASLGDRERAWEVVRRLGTLRRDKLHDGPGALEALRGACDLRPDDVESRAALAELYAAKGDRSQAVRELEIAAARAPLRAQTHRRLFELHARAQRQDRAWLVATCLEELGGADVAQDLVVEQFRPNGPIRPTVAVDEEAWERLLRADGGSRLASDVLRAVGPAAVAVRLEELEKSRKLPALDPSKKQDRASTASVVRTFVWAARALALPLPELYLLDEVPSGIAAVPHETAATALGPDVRTGVTVQELAFLAGRHLTYYRPEHYPLVFYPTLADLGALVLASVRLCLRGFDPEEADSPSAALARKLKKHLDDGARAELSRAVTALDAEGGTLDLLAYLRSVELTANRAGLLLCGDLRVAMRVLKSESRAVGDLTAEGRRADLLGFSASAAYAELRERIGVAILPPASPV